MKILRHIAFFLSIFVMMGHDVIPHFHDSDHDLPELSATLPQSTGDGLKDLQNSFSEFQHPTAEHNLVYLVSLEKTSNLLRKIHYNAPIIFTAEYRPAWYANFKKQRFREDIHILASLETTYFSLRAPPSC
ncbi:hypothetical protein [Daejeonella sp.]|uniref:hypothetical protein n=1 Tax=Daejeonella sp. TaxID=2805397 RepID=UPI002728C70C|nr:hypothetical protein [Daejeonella sp.]MDO8992419.1 hypothetical protein [Daejeonella sp.]MDP2412749.1 hypothetical protein [Daejeonella sp.]